VKAGAVLFQIDPAPYTFKVNQLEASLAHAKQQAQQLKANYEQATASVEGLTRQLAFQTQRLADMRKLASTKAVAEFREQETQAQYDTVQFQLQAAKASHDSARLALESEIGGVNTTVAQVLAQLEQAKWELDQTTIRAPSDGYVSTMAWPSAPAPYRRAR
jgi:multidrug resistance efflux pump